MKYQVTNEEAHMTNIENPIVQLAHTLEEQYSRTLPSDIKDEDNRECNFVPMSFEEIQEPILVKEKKNELTNEKELLVEKRQVEEHHPLTIIQNVLVRIDKCNFPIDFVTLGMEEDQQVPSIGTLSNATSQAWIDVEHEEMTLLVGKEKVKFNLHRSIQLTNEEKMTCILIESSFLHFEEQAPKILQEDTLEEYKFEVNSFPTEELAFEFTSPIPEVEEVILMSDKDEEGVFATMDEEPKRRSRTSQ